MNSDNLILRQNAFPPLTNKGAQLTSDDFDNNFINVYKDFKAMFVTNSVDAYNPGTTYDDTVVQFASYNARTWKWVNAVPNAGVTPVSGADWQEIFPTLMAHRKNSDTLLNEGGANEVSAAALKILVDAGTPQNLGSADMDINDPLRYITLDGDAAADALITRNQSLVEIMRIQGDERIQTGKIEVGKVGTPVQYALNFQGNFANSGLAKGLNHLGALIFDFRQIGADASLGLQNGAGVQQIFLNAQSGKINVTGKYQQAGVDGFTGTGSFTNFTIAGGIITAAT